MTDDYNLGSGPVEAKYVEAMKDMARFIDHVFNGDTKPKGTGFVLLVFPFGEGGKGRVNYMSNALREDVKTMLKEQLAYFEGQSDKHSGTA